MSARARISAQWSRGFRAGAGRRGLTFIYAKRTAARAPVRAYVRTYVKLITQLRKRKISALSALSENAAGPRDCRGSHCSRPNGWPRNSFRYRMFDAPRAPFSAAHLTDIEKIDQKCKSGLRWERRGEGGRESAREILWNGTRSALLATLRICRQGSKITIRRSRTNGEICENNSKSESTNSIDCYIVEESCLMDGSVAEGLCNRRLWYRP